MSTSSSEVKFNMKQITRLLAAMRAYSIDDDDDKSIIDSLEHYFTILKAEAYYQQGISK